jgi:hypothetical protein
MAHGASAGAAAPDFAFERYFLGRTRGWGVLQDRGGGMLRRFTVDMEGVRDADGALKLTETIDFDDGERMNREWTVRPSGAGRFTPGRRMSKAWRWARAASATCAGDIPSA